MNPKLARDLPIALAIGLALLDEFGLAHPRARSRPLTATADRATLSARRVFGVRAWRPGNEADEPP